MRYLAVRSIIISLFLILNTKMLASTQTDAVSHIVINPSCEQQDFEGFGVSLCWWANMCGNWSDDKIDEIVDWLVSPEGLNYRIFRYNIGGGDDPENRNCTPHHMANGKGLRAEMEGFKDSSEGPYIWTRDAAQRKILLKIKEKRPDAVFEAFSNSCPYYMTYSGCCSGNINDWEDNLRPEYYEEFAQYLIDVCKHYKDVYDIEFKTIAPFNEPKWSGWTANGSQEGCNFNIDSQIKFIGILSQVINESGLNIKIAAPDLSYGQLYVKDFRDYESADIIKMIDRFNVHTYVTSNKYRTQLDMLCNKHNLPLWVSETGPLWDVSSGSRKGIVGNLYLAGRLIEDLRYLRPTAWLDWQYIEAEGDQWCLVRSKDFSEEDYTKVKNYYVRSHFSKFIGEGWSILTTLNANTLAAHSPIKDKLVIVTINTDTIPTEYIADLSMYVTVESNIDAYVTSETEDMAVFNDYMLNDRKLCYTIPEKSIITFVIPIEVGNPNDFENLIIDNGTYLIYPRAAEEKVIESVDTEVQINSLILESSQKWKLQMVEDGIILKNVDKGTATRSTTDHRFICNTNEDIPNQLLKFIPIDDKYYTIETVYDKQYLMLSDFAFSDETNVIFGDIAGLSAPTNAHWGIVRLSDYSTSSKTIDKVDAEQQLAIDVSVPGCLSIRKLDSINEVNLKIYNQIGQCIFTYHLSDPSLSIPLASGIYIVTYGDGIDYHSERILVK